MSCTLQVVWAAEGRWRKIFSTVMLRRGEAVASRMVMLLKYHIHLLTTHMSIIILIIIHHLSASKTAIIIPYSVLTVQRDEAHSGDLGSRCSPHPSPWNTQRASGNRYDLSHHSVLETVGYSTEELYIWLLLCIDEDKARQRASLEETRGDLLQDIHRGRGVTSRPPVMIQMGLFRHHVVTAVGCQGTAAWAADTILKNNRDLLVNTSTASPIVM